MSDLYIARQPIYDRQLSVYGYELLYRAGDTNSANVVDGDVATSQVLVNALMEIGLPELVGRGLAFINLTERYILEGLPEVLAQAGVVLEILEDVRPHAAILEALASLKQQGYVIALDDFVLDDDKLPLLALADLVKIDLTACTDARLEAQIERLKSSNAKLLAEKVETREEFEHCKALGFDYFQGYFFSKPHLIKGKRAPTNRIAVLRLLALLQNPELDFADLETIIGQDVSLSYRILRYINSAQYYFANKITSTKHAVTLLGIRTLRRWVTILTLSNLDDVKPLELMITTLVRAKMCETLAPKLRIAPDSAFTVGLFSTLDAFTDQPMEEVLGQLPLADDINLALTIQQGPLGDLLQRVIAYEKGQWEDVAASNLDPAAQRDAYLQAIRFASDISESLISRK
jgi:EAL and modified HD-GYP domain-containing signal transduction protein